MQQKIECNNLMRPAEYARLRGLNRSTVSRQIRDGKIPIHDGLVDPREADLARSRNLTMSQRRKAAVPIQRDPVEPDFQLGMEYLARALRAEGRIGSLRDIAIEATEIAITPHQADRAARMFVYMTSLWVKDLLEQTLGARYARAFDRDLAAWLASWPKEGE
jgi:hypothetical protein